MRLRLLAVVASLASFFFVLLGPRLAFAQSIDIAPASAQSLVRLDANGNNVNKRPLNLTPEGVSFQDCEDNQQIQFPLVLTGNVPSSTIEAWASTGSDDCSQSATRSGTTQRCWKLNNGASIATAPTVLVNLFVREIISGGNNRQTTPDKSAAVCGTVDFTTFNVYFLYFPPGGQVGNAGAFKNVTVSADTVGPDPPSGVSILPGNTRLQISFDTISGEAGGSVALTGVSAYCDPAQSAPTTPTTPSNPGTTLVCDDSGSTDAADDDAIADASTDTCVEVPNEGGSTPTPGGGSGNCYSPNFVDPDGGGAIQPNADFNKKFQCGSLVGNTGSSVVADSVGGHPLVNGVHYAVAVAGTDAFGNVGKLSLVLCDYPEETTDFWTAYKAAGGGSGGGFCTTSGAGMPVASLTVLGIVALALASTFRRRRSRRR
jgi:hypothetical protein